MTRNKSRRRGIAVIAVIAVLILMLAVFGMLVRLGMQERKQVREEERRVAASWLAESGLERAAARLQANHSYTGETWNLSPKELGGQDGASILIKVEAVVDQPERRTLRVWADLPADGIHRVRQSRVAIFDFESAKSGENQ